MTREFFIIRVLRKQMHHIKFYSNNSRTLAGVSIEGSSYSRAASINFGAIIHEAFQKDGSKKRPVYQGCTQVMINKGATLPQNQAKADSMLLMGSRNGGEEHRE